MFLASVGAPEGYVDALSGYANKKKRQRLKKKMLEMPERRPVTEKTLKVSTSKSKGSRASHSSLAVFVSLVPPTGRSQHEPTDKD